VKATENITTIILAAERLFKLILSRKKSKQHFSYICYGYEIIFKISYVVACKQFMLHVNKRL